MSLSVTAILNSSNGRAVVASSDSRKTLTLNQRKDNVQTFEQTVTDDEQKIFNFNGDKLLVISGSVRGDSFSKLRGVLDSCPVDETLSPMKAAKYAFKIAEKVNSLDELNRFLVEEAAIPHVESHRKQGATITSVEPFQSSAGVGVKVLGTTSSGDPIDDLYYPFLEESKFPKADFTVSGFKKLASGGVRPKVFTLTTHHQFRSRLPDFKDEDTNYPSLKLWLDGYATTVPINWLRNISNDELEQSLVVMKAAQFPSLERVEELIRSIRPKGKNFLERDWSVASVEDVASTLNNLTELSKLMHSYNVCRMFGGVQDSLEPFSSVGGPVNIGVVEENSTSPGGVDFYWHSKAPFVK